MSRKNSNKQQQRDTHNNNNNNAAASQQQQLSHIQMAEIHKAEGNRRFGRGEYSVALSYYLKGAGFLVLEEEEEEDTKDLKAVLYANAAFAACKLNEFGQAVEYCTQSLECEERPKVYYRRAVAREQIGDSLLYTPKHSLSSSSSFEWCLVENGSKGGTSNKKMSCVYNKVREMWNGSLEDINQCIKILLSQSHNNKPDQKSMNDARVVQDRIRMKFLSIPSDDKVLDDFFIENILKDKRQKSTTSSVDMNGECKHNSHVAPGIKEQRSSVAVMLSQSKSPRQYEAFFLINYKWWCHLCKYIGFDQFDLLPPGGQPLYKSLLKIHKRKDMDDSSDDDTSLSEDECNEVSSPGPIQTNDLLERDDNGVFHLKHDLVRGYHYEILPREVYHALKCWYGESIEFPRVCRKVDVVKDGKFRLPLFSKNSVSYPSNGEFVPPKRSHVCGACRKGATSRCSKCQFVFYCSVDCQRSHLKYHIKECRKLRNDAYGPDLSLTEWGMKGLTNLGNTCFMNSSLQCLSHAFPLTKYFLSNHFSEDLNKNNPLGTGGNLVKAYAATMRELYWNAYSSHISPTQLKRAIAQFAPRFAGYSQHDAQEFLAYLLDGLHEDLNRIERPPYIEIPDAEDYSNLKIAGAEAWEAYQRRNDSLLVDKFYGQFKSTCVCPNLNCKSVSTSFDSFNHVSLELPNVSYRTISVIFARMMTEESSRNAPYLRYGLNIKSDATIEELRNMLSDEVGIKPENLVLADVYENVIYAILQMDKLVNTIDDKDIIVAYEIQEETSSLVHVIGCHKKIGSNSAQQSMGFPIYTTIRDSMTTSEVRNHIWFQVRGFFIDDITVAGNGAKSPSSLKLRVCDSKGTPINIKKEVNNGDEDASLYSLLEDGNNTMIDIFGSECFEHYIFLSVEWNEDIWDNRLDESAFVSVEDHQSFDPYHKKPSSVTSLDSCFDAFTRPERLDENNQWYCSKCKQHVRAMKTMCLWKLPEILIVHLKRFEFRNTFLRDKLDTFIDFPLEGLDMSKHLRNDTNDGFVDTESSALYDCFAVTNHYGRLGFGHYTAYARQWDDNQISNDWTSFDDSHTMVIPRSSVVSSAAYVLFYRRRH